MRDRALRVLLQGVLTTAAVIAGGCVPRSRLQTVASCYTHPDLRDDLQSVQLCHASADADHFLYRHQGDAKQLMETVHLRKGLPVGFRRASNGSVFAVAGDREFPLQPELVALPRNGASKAGALGVPALSYYYEWCRHPTEGERWLGAVAFVGLFPFLLGAASGGAP